MSRWIQSSYLSKSCNQIKLGLDRMYELMEHLGNPHLKIKNVIHVAGTNGKGSTCAFLDQILRDHGYSTNLYTSPDLVTFNERIKRNGINVSDDLLGTYESRCQSIPNIEDFTFFEITTAIAFAIFAEHEADFTILEVGLGGRLDATNIVANVILSIITSISLDHTELLGGTIEAIATEKSGILRKDIPVITSFQKDIEVVNIIHDNATSIETKEYHYNDDWNISINNNTFDYKDKFGHELKDVKTSLIGDHQFYNASTAIFTSYFLQDTGLISVNESAIKSSVNSTSWPGRIENIKIYKLQNAERVIFDGSHNEDSIRVLCEYLSRLPYQKVGIFGCLRGKDIHLVSDIMSKTFEKIYCITIQEYFSDKVRTGGEIAAILAPSGIDLEISENINTAVEKVHNIASNKIIVIFGSLYLGKEVYRLIN